MQCIIFPDPPFLTCQKIVTHPQFFIAHPHLYFMTGPSAFLLHNFFCNKHFSNWNWLETVSFLCHDGGRDKYLSYEYKLKRKLSCPILFPACHVLYLLVIIIRALSRSSVVSLSYIHSSQNIMIHLSSYKVLYYTYSTLKLYRFASL